MAESLSEIFERLLSKQQVLVERYRLPENKLDAAEQEKAALENTVRQQQVRMEKPEMDNEYLRIARRIAPDDDALDKSRALIAKLVRDVDKCIEQLNE